jgi:hypothetical protein
MRSTETLIALVIALVEDRCWDEEQQLGIIIAILQKLLVMERRMDDAGL